MKKGLMAMACLLILTGCEFLHQQRTVYIRDRGEDYLTSELVAPLDVPAPLTYHHSQVFPLPDVAPELGSLDNISIQPPGFGDAL